MATARTRIRSGTGTAHGCRLRVEPDRRLGDLFHPGGRRNRETAPRAEGNRVSPSYAPDGTLLFIERSKGTERICCRSRPTGGDAFLEAPFEQGGRPVLSGRPRRRVRFRREGPRRSLRAPLAGPAPRSPVSSDGGNAPRWSPDGRQIFYRPGRRVHGRDRDRGGRQALHRGVDAAVQKLAPRSDAARSSRGTPCRRTAGGSLIHSSPRARFRRGSTSSSTGSPSSRRRCRRTQLAPGAERTRRHSSWNLGSEARLSIE